MNLRKAIKVACAVKETNMAEVERKVYGKECGNLYHISNQDRTPKGPRLSTLQGIADALDMKLSELIALGE